MSEEREQRNQIFAGATQQPSAGQGLTTTSAADKVKADFGLDIPLELVPLPSGGKVYPVGSSLYGKDSVEIKAMTAREEDILTSKALLKKGTVITELIRSCLMDKTVNPSDLLIGDRNALMVAIRITGYGSEYDAEIECNDCGTKAPQQFDLSQLPINRMLIEPVEPGVNCFEYVLPYTKKTVRFKFLTGRDEEEISATAERQKKLNMQGESVITSNLLYSIVSVEGIEDRAKIAGFVKAIPARDSLSLRTYIKDSEPGIRMKQETSCPSCGHSEEVSMPIGVSFLWPSATK